MAESRDEALHRVLALVAEGRLSADEAAPILDALSKKGGSTSDTERHAGHSGHAAHQQPPTPPAPDQPAAPGDRPRFARIQVIENGRRSVDLRIPVGLGRFALSKVPGLSSDQIDEVQDALSLGTHGPILDVQDADGDGVRIILE